MPSYLAPYFDHDVFMSYAHGRLPGEAYAPLRSWSQKFIDLLRADIYAPTFMRCNPNSARSVFGTIEMLIRPQR